MVRNLRLLFQETKYANAQLNYDGGCDGDKNFHNLAVFDSVINVTEYRKRLYLQLFISLYFR